MVFGKLSISGFNGMAVIVGYPGIRSFSGGKPKVKLYEKKHEEALCRVVGVLNP